MSNEVADRATCVTPTRVLDDARGNAIERAQARVEDSLPNACRFLSRRVTSREREKFS